jgi:hypothetical protein
MRSSRHQQGEAECRVEFQVALDLSSTLLEMQGSIVGRSQLSQQLTSK